MSPRSLQLDPGTIRRLTVDTDPLLSCDECFHLVDQYVEALLGVRRADLTGMQAHLGGCPACAEEATTLLLLAADDLGLDPTPALDQVQPRP